VILSYFGGDAPGEPERRWGDRTEDALFAFASLTDEPDAYLDGAYYAVDGAMPGPKLYDLAEVEKLPGVGERHPVSWVHGYGEGRVFALTIGHVGASTIEDAHEGRRTGRDVGPSIDVATRTVGFTNLLRRGTEWAATGRVTLPVVDDIEVPTPA